MENPFSVCQTSHCILREHSCIYFPLFYAKGIAEQVAMNQREIAFFLAFYLYRLNMGAANDTQRVILLSFMT